MYCIIILIVVHSFPFSLPEDKGYTLQTNNLTL